MSVHSLFARILADFYTPRPSARCSHFAADDPRSLMPCLHQIPCEVREAPDAPLADEYLREADSAEAERFGNYIDDFR